MTDELRLKVAALLQDAMGVDLAAPLPDGRWAPVLGDDDALGLAGEVLDLIEAERRTVPAVQDDTGGLPVFDRADLEMNGWLLGSTEDGGHPALVVDCDCDHLHALAFPPKSYIMCDEDGDLVAENLVFHGPRRPGPRDPHA